MVVLMVDFTIYEKHPKEVNSCSHGKRLYPNEIVGTCRICNKYTCSECNVDLPVSSIIGFYCKNCMFKVAVRIVLILLITFLFIKLLDKTYNFSFEINIIENIVIASSIILLLMLLKKI